MSREVQVRFCESRGVRFPPATHPAAEAAVSPEKMREMRNSAMIQIRGIAARR